MDVHVVLGLAVCIVLNHALAANYTVNDCPTSAPHDSRLKVFRDSCYSFQTSQQREFPAAEAECKSRQGHVVTVRDAETQMFLYNELRHEFHDTGAVWIGLTDRESEGHFVWADGSQARYTNWRSGQPGGIGFDEDCVVMDLSDQGQWSDLQCSGFLFFFQHAIVCEYPIVRSSTEPVTQATTSVTSTSSVTPTSSRATTASVVATESQPPSPTHGHDTTAAVSPSWCVQCGDDLSDTACTETQLRQPATRCPPAHPYCVSDVRKESPHSPVIIFKRCADHRSCMLEWYLPSQHGGDYCLRLDNTTPDFFVCHICCHGNACNNATVPPTDTLFQP